MVYTVGEMAKLLGVTASTLRYYDKEGLLPFVERSSGGIRMFQESDIEWLQVIGCMKKGAVSQRGSSFSVCGKKPGGRRTSPFDPRQPRFSLFFRKYAVMA